MDLYQMVFSHNLLGRFALYKYSCAHAVRVSRHRIYSGYTVIKYYVHLTMYRVVYV